MDITPIAAISNVAPALLTEGWWDMVWVDYRTTLMTASAIISAYVAASGNKKLASIWAGVVGALPWSKK